jgi:AraC-like DNA-binding protein
MDTAPKRVSIHWVKAILSAAKSLGFEEDVILKDLDFLVDLDKNQPAYLTLDQTQDIWAKAESLSGHPFFGLRMGELVRPSYFHAVAYVAMTSENLLKAYQSFIHYMPLISEAGRMNMAFEGDKVWIYFDPKIDTKPFSRHQRESVVSLLQAFSRWLKGDSSFEPTDVHFVHEPGPGMAEYQRIFGLTPKFNQSLTGIQFKRELLAKSLVESDVGLNALHQTHADQLLAAHLNTSWKAKVIQIIVTSGIYNVSRERVADHFNVSTRTLQRRLKEEGTNFLEVVDAQRKQKAHELICKTHKSLKEVALDLGFSESSTFYRACHRWFDQTPNSMRQGAEPSS